MLIIHLLSIPITWDFSMNPEMLIDEHIGKMKPFNSHYLGFLHESAQQLSHGQQRIMAFNSHYLGFLHESEIFTEQRNSYLILSIPITWDFSMNLAQGQFI